MTDRPIIFSGPMIRALLAREKTQTRRVIKPSGFISAGWPLFPSYLNGQRTGDTTDASFTDLSELNGGNPLYVGVTPVCPGDRLWVREAHAIVPPSAYRASTGVETRWNPHDDYQAAVYREGWERCKPGSWRPSIHMPRWASRLTLTVTDVRVQRLNVLTDEDAIAEGIDYHGSPCAPSVIYAKLWDELNAKKGFPWKSNPWIVALTFQTELNSVQSNQ